jgi:N-acetylglucosamine-6-sulfatase
LLRTSTLIAACLLAALAAASAARAQAPATRPNVIVIMTDDQTVGDLRSMGLTRTLLGGGGVTFKRSYVSYPVCCPSRATYLSGQYAHNHRVLGNYAPSGGYGRFDKQENLPVWLNRAGYHTVHVGRYLNGYGSETPADVPPGWSEWYGAVGTSSYRMWGYTLNENGKRHTYGAPLRADPSLYQTDVLRDRALGVIRRRSGAGRPFFLSIAFLAPHLEGSGIRSLTDEAVRPAPRHDGLLDRARVPRPRSFNERDVSDKPRPVRRRRKLDADDVTDIRDRYQEREESLFAVDDAVQSIVDELGRDGVLDRTYVVLTSDNGFMQGEHRVPGGKVLPYDPSTQVPLLLRGPGIPAGGVSRELVGNIDLAPTILEIAGATPGKVVDGRSLLPFARNPGLLSSRPFLHETGGRRYVPGGDVDAGEAPSTRRQLTYRAVRTRRWLWVEYRGRARELYDLVRDPAELRSRHADPRYRRTRAALHRVLLRLAHCTGDGCRAEIGPIPRPARRRR